MPTDLSAYIRDVPDFPQPGIVFKDITPLLAEPAAFTAAVTQLAAILREAAADEILGIESRGFILGAAFAAELGLPLQLVRKPGKQPRTTTHVDYSLEYGVDRVEVHTDSISPGRRYAIVDDLLATGGTAAATVELVERCGGELACCAFVIELGFLDGREKLPANLVTSLIQYD